MFRRLSPDGKYEPADILIDVCGPLLSARRQAVWLLGYVGQRGVVLGGIRHSRLVGRRWLVYS